MGKEHYPPEISKLIRKMMNSKPSCPNVSCLRTFRNAKGVACHFNKSIICQQAMKNAFFCQQTNDSLVTNNDNVQDENIEDIEDTIDTDEMNTDEPTQSVCFTDNIYYQTKLAKILDDANAANYVYQEIIEWAIHAQDAKINFRDLKKTREGNIKEILNCCHGLNLQSHFSLKQYWKQKQQNQSLLMSLSLILRHSYLVCLITRHSLGILIIWMLFQTIHLVTISHLVTFCQLSILV